MSKKKEPGQAYPPPVSGGAGTGEFEPPPYARRKKVRWSRLLWLLLLVPLIYIGVQIAIIMMPRMRTEVAIQETMTDSLASTGYVVLQSAPVHGTGGGSLFYTVPTGQRVSVGAEVAKVFPSSSAVDAMMSLQAIDNEIALLEQAQTTIEEGGDAETVLKALQDGVFDYISALDGGDFTRLDGPRDEIALAANKLQVATSVQTDFNARIAYLNGLKQSYQAQAGSASSIAAPETGYFVPSSGHDRLHGDYETLTAISPAQLRDALEQTPKYYGNDVIGHVVTEYKWHFFASVAAKEAEALVEGAKLELAFPDHDINGLPVVVDSIELDEDVNLAKVVFSCEYMSPEILQLRVERASIIFRTLKGLRIDKNALRVIDGERYVYVRFGNQVYQRRIKILLEDEHYLLVSPEYEEGVNEVKMYDDVIVDSGGTELYDKKIL